MVRKVPGVGFVDCNGAHQLARLFVHGPRSMKLKRYPNHCPRKSEQELFGSASVANW